VITQIDVRNVLVQLGHGRPDLVTRPTGRAVRSSIEHELMRLSGRTIVVLDFSDVRIIDCSCADEIVAKLVQASLAHEEPDTFFLIRGLDDHQMSDIEEVLRPQRLALVAESDGRLRLIGEVTVDAHAAFGLLAARGAAAAQELADALAWSLEAARTVLDELAGRRLVLVDAGRYVPLHAA
jgi:hypothetical protein